MRVAINGFGRIGRLTFRKLFKRDDIEVVAVNDLSDANTLAHLLQYDSVHGSFPYPVDAGENKIIIEGNEIEEFSNESPEELPWSDLEIDVVLECTGLFRTGEKASQHLEAGAENVIISAPPKSKDVPTVVLGVNDHRIDFSGQLFSNASCTTNCLAPMIKIMHENWSLRSGMVTTTHAYTGSQNLQDGAHKDLRRARAAAQNIVPTSTGAAKATELVYPEIKGKLFATAMRIPVVCGSLTELTCTLEEMPDTGEINQEFKSQASGALKGILEYSEAPLVSTDILSSSHSAIFDAELTVRQGNQMRIVAWYDNEFGYSSRLADLVPRVVRN